MLVLPDAFGNALGNSLVKRVSDYQEERLRETEKLSQNMAAIDAKNASGFAVDGLLGTLGKIDQDVADNIHDDFYGELFVSTQLNDQLAGIASDKNANAIFKYNAMSAQAKKDIAAIEQRSRQSAQTRAEQWDTRQARQQQKLIDFRMANPVYRASEPIFDYEAALAADNAMWGEGKLRAQKDSTVDIFGDQRQNMLGSTVIDQTAASFGLIDNFNNSKGLIQASEILEKTSNVKSMKLKSDAILMSGTASSALSHVKSGQARSVLESTANVSQNLKSVGKALPWIYGAAQVGEEYQFAIDRKLNTEQILINTSTRIGGTVVEVVAGTALIGQSTLVGATIGTFIAPGVGTVIGGGVGAVIGTVAYTFTDWLPGVEKSIGTSINNAVTNTSRTVIGWFQ